MIWILLSAILIKLEFIVSISQEYYQYKNRQSGACIYSNADGRFSYAECSNWSDQYWTMDDYDGTYFRLKNENSQKCIYQNADGRFGVSTCLSYTDQYWYKYDTDGDYFHLRNKHSSNCLYQNSDGRFSFGNCGSWTDQYWSIIEYFHIKNRQSENCIYQNSDGRFSYGTCANYADQYWTMDNKNGIYFRLKNRQSNSCIIQNSDGRFGYFDCEDYADQYWYKYNVDGDYFHLKNKQSGNCIYQNSDGRFSFSTCQDYADQYWILLYRYSSHPTEYPTPYPTTNINSDGNINITPNISTISIKSCNEWDYGSMSSTLHMQLKGLNGITEFFIVNSKLPLPTQGESTIFNVEIDTKQINKLYSVLLFVDDLSGYCIQDLQIGYYINNSLSSYVEYIFNSSSYFGNGIILSNKCKHSYQYISSNIPLISCIESYLELNVYKQRGIYELDIHTCIIDDAGMSINDMKNNLYATIMGKETNQQSYINTEITYLDNYVPGIFNFNHLGHMIAENIPLRLLDNNPPVLSSNIVNQKIIGIKIEGIQEEALSVSNIHIEIDGIEIQLNSKLFDDNRVLIGFIDDRSNRIDIVESSRIKIYKDTNLQYDGNINVYAIFEGFEELYQLPFVVGYNQEPMDWYSANHACQDNYGTSLASIHSEIEDFILNGLITQKGVGIFIGLIRLELDGRWTWIDQSHLDFTKWEHGQGITNRNEDCGEMYESNWMWNDIPCSKIENQYFICSSPYWNKDTNRKFEINSINKIDDIVLVSIGNNNNLNNICVDSISVNSESAKHISNTIIGGNSGILSSSAIIKYPICKTEVVGMTIDYDSSTSQMIEGDATISGLQCSNGNRLIPATCSISQSFEMSKVTSFSISNEDSSTSEYSWGISSSITTGTSSSQSTTTSNEFSFGFNQELSIGISATVEAGVQAGVVTASASVENRLDFSFGSNQQWTQSNEKSNELSQSRERSQEQNNQNTKSNSLTNGYESSYESSETLSIECSGEIEVPPSHSIQYSLIFNSFNVTLNTYTDLKLTLCSALINPDNSNNNENNFIYIDNIPGVIQHKQTTTCQVQFSPAQYIRNDMTCIQEQRLSISDQSEYVPKCKNDHTTLYDGCQCSNGEDSISICWCVDELGNQLNNKIIQLKDEQTNQQVCTHVLQCSNTEYSLLNHLVINKSVLHHNNWIILTIVFLSSCILLFCICRNRKKINLNMIKNWQYQTLSTSKQQVDDDDDLKEEEDGINTDFN